MKKSTLRLIACVATGVGGLLVSQTATAATYTWDVSKTGTLYWYTPANWGGSGYPNSPGDVANLNGDFTANTVVRTDAGGTAAMVAGIINLGDSALTSSAFQTIQIGNSNGHPAITLDNNGSPAQINVNPNNISPAAALTNNFRANVVLEDDLTVNVPNNLYNIKFWGAISGSYGITKTGNGFMSIEAAGGSSTYSGLTLLQAGRLQVAGNAGNIAIPGNIRVTGGRLQNTGNDAIADTANIEFQGGDWNMGTASDTVGSLTSTTAGSIFSGNTLGLAAVSGTTSYGGTISVTNFNKTAGSTQTLAGAGANVFTNVSVTGGILQLNKTAGTNALSGAITAGNGAGAGTIRLLAADQIDNASTLTLNAGTLDTNGVSEALATLTNGGASTIDMGAGASILSFGNSSAQIWSGTIQILNWSGLTAGGGTDQLLFGAGGLNAGQVGMISFVNPTNYAPGTYPATLLPSGEVVAVVPEPAVLGTIAASSLLFLRRRRVRA